MPDETDRISAFLTNAQNSGGKTTQAQPGSQITFPLWAVAVGIADYIRYAARDVQTTWECFDVLRDRFESLGLFETGLYDLYSEASLGKAYLKTMNVKPWRDAQPDFSAALIGIILSTYYGGRSEVHIRRQITPVIHCDFLSMYPTVCTLMGLWDFVRAEGVEYNDDTHAIQAMLATPISELVESLRHKSAWRDLTAIVQVLPNHDLFPVRAQYPGSDTANIGLNYLTADDPQWFTLADVLVSKILTGRTPKVVSAIRFSALARQPDLRPVEVAGITIDPSTDDFYQQLIVHRNAIKARYRDASTNAKAALKSDEQGVKILANATSYGIFVELNIEDFDVAQPMIGYSGSVTFKFKSKKFEKPGRYFHPLLGTLITGAARLMLSLAEYQVIEQRLDWAFCDTDSIAIANVASLPAEDFKRKALAVQSWFRDLNPYGEDRSILQLEDVNFPVGKSGDVDSLDPPLCLAVSAKRYVLFNQLDGTTVVRKATGHGLGHLVAPYDESAEERHARIELVGVPRWQEDLWQELIRAAHSDEPEAVAYLEMPGYDAPAASQYAATTPDLLRWLDGYNAHRPEGEKVFPFGFLLSLQVKSRLEMAQDDPEALSHELWRRREPRPAAPFYKRPPDAKEHAFDRERSAKIPGTWLKSIGRSLTRYHLHQETKFLGGEYDQRGPLMRRHVFAIARQSIGKEGDDIEESEFIGAYEGPVEFGFARKDQAAIRQAILDAKEQHKFSDRELLERALVSHHTLAALRDGRAIGDEPLGKLLRAIEDLRRDAVAAEGAQENSLQELRRLSKQVGGRSKLAQLLGVNPSHLGRLLSGERPMTKAVFEKMENVKSGFTGEFR